MSTSLVLEFGSHSLKVHYQSRTSGIFRKSRFPWDLGHEVYSNGRISSRTANRAIETLELLRKKGIEPRSVLAIATGALRDAENAKSFLAVLERKLGLKVRIISGREEASLLAQGYLAQSSDLPALIADIGGGSLELVYLGEDKTILRDSLPLGAIRVHHFGQDEKGVFRADVASGWIEDSFQDASVITADEIFCTGGTAKAIAKTFHRPTVTRDELAELEKRTEERGPPSHLKPDRAKVFLPGLIVLRKLVDHAQAQRLTHLKVPVGRIFLQKYAKRVPDSARSERRNNILQDLRITQIYNRQSVVGLHADDLRSGGEAGAESGRDDSGPSSDSK